MIIVSESFPANFQIGICSALSVKTEIDTCASCVFMDKRPESTIQGGLLYCQKKRLVIRPKQKCDSYIQATDRNLERLKTMLYGRAYSEDEEE